jgi:hypothetical protein
MPIQDIKDMTSFKWATVAAVEPLSVQLDGDTAPLAMVPDTLVYPLSVGERVRVELSQRKAVVHGSSLGGSKVQYATLGPYWTFGAPYVTMADGTMKTVGGHASTYVPTNGDSVAVLPLRDGTGEVYVLGKAVKDPTPGLLAFVKPTYQNGWTDYGGGWNPGAFSKTADGIVSLSGLVKPVTNSNVLTTIFNLPVGFRPDYDLVFDTNNTDTVRSLVVKANGDIQMITNNGASTFFINLDGICFPAAGVANWVTTGITLQNGFTQITAGLGGAFAGLNFGPVRYWEDTNGLVWWQGVLLHPTAVTADNTPMILFPAALAAESREHHFVSETDNVWGAIGINSTNSYHSLNWKIGNQTSNTQLSLNRVVYPKASQMTGFVYPALGSGWVQGAGTQFTVPGYKKLANGMIYVQGFMNSGSVATASKIWNQPAGTRPSWYDTGHAGAGAMFNRPSNATTRARILGDQNGDWSIEQGNNGWVSLDGMIYIPRS